MAALSYLEEWKIPVSADILHARDNKYAPSPESIRLLNIQPEFGGEDFLFTNEKARFVMLCNIAKDVDDEFKIRDGKFPDPGYLSDCFMSSQYHDDTRRWADKLSEVGADIVMVTGYDSFELDNLNDGSYVAIDIRSGMKGFLIKKDYLASAEIYLALQDSPLTTAPSEIERYNTNSFSYDRKSRALLPY